MAKFSGVLVYSRICQVTGPVARVAKNKAGQGYIIIAPFICHSLVLCEPLADDVE